MEIWSDVCWVRFARVSCPRLRFVKHGNLEYGATAVTLLNSASERLLTRKKQQTRREVKRARRTWHRSRNARVECTVGEHATVHSTALFTILIDLQSWPSTPFVLSRAAPMGPCVAC